MAAPPVPMVVEPVPTPAIVGTVPVVAAGPVSSDAPVAAAPSNAPVAATKERRDAIERIKLKFKKRSNAPVADAGPSRANSGSSDKPPSKPSKSGKASGADKDDVEMEDSELVDL
ncbi:hypothetical protein A0H81_13844 [Grifola frondosa]|uniref:Uncharacterized protein n=1 Tax=Grifola frondosa TaxID=5627 RepID=A0A1C7LNT8_GRIFR|nr:hypothetical protein A0H81_13844 [Grifola frondosa]